MNALGRKAIEARFVAELRALPAAAKPNLREIRLAIAAELGSCSTAELASAVQSLRYQGKLAWDRLELSSTMIEQDATPCVVEGGGSHSSPPSIDAPGSAELDVEDGVVDGRAGPSAAPSSGPDDEDDEDYPGGVNDAEPAFHPTSAFSANRHKAGVHAAATRAAGKPLPAPAHEPEVARQVREEVNEGMARRARARSTGTVRVPLELRKFGVPDMGLGEGVASLLAEQPHDLLVAINRKHPQLWKRVIMLGRARGEGPAAALYAALEAGLEQLEPTEVNNGA